MPAAAAGAAPSTLDVALGYARRGWRVVPIPPGEKFPRGITAWQTEGSTDEAKITHWWTQAPDHGIGIVTGATSGLWVLDVDTDRTQGKHGDESLAELEATHGPLPDTYEVVTGSGGRHLYFAWPDDPTIEIRNDQSGQIGPDLDVRADGGFVVAPPSIHKYGTRYEVEATSAPAPVQAPAWLVEAASKKPEPQAPTARPQHPATTGDRPGDLYAAATTWAQILEADGWTHHHTDRDGEDHWTRPGKDRRDGTSATTGYKGSDVLKVFTSSHPQLRADETYTKLGYLAATRHGGDHAAAARALAADGHRSDPLAGVLANVRHLPAATSTPHAAEPDPTAIPDSIPPPVPIDAFPPWIADQITNVARQLGCDPVLPAVFALGALSVASLGHIQVKLRAGETLRSTGLYLAAAGVPATGKSPALDFMIDPVRDHEEACITHAASEVARAEASRSIADKKAKEAIDAAARSGADPATEADALRLKAAAAAIEIPPAGEMMTTNITPEKLAGLMQANAERMAIVSDESGVLTVDRYGDKNSGANMDVYLQGFTGQQVTVHRVTAPNIRMRHPLLAIVAGVQPEKLTEALANEEFRVRGLGSRFLTASCSKLATNTDIDLDLWNYQVGDTYAERLTALARQWSSWNNPAVLTIDPPARRRYSAWAAELRHQEADGGPLEGESGWVSKLRSSTVRIAALFHLADGARHDDPITLDVLERAIRVADFFIAHHCRDTSDTTGLARRLLKTMVELSTHDDTTDGIIPKRTLGRNASRNLRTLKQYAAPMAVLVDCGWVEPVPDTLSFAASTEDAVAAAKGFRLHPAATRRDATRATTVDAEWSPETESHGESTNVARVARVAKGSLETPSPPPFQEPQGGPGDTRDTRDNRHLIELDPDEDIFATHQEAP